MNAEKSQDEQERLRLQPFTVPVVIPVKTGIQDSKIIKPLVDPRLRGNDKRKLLYG